MDAIDLRFDKKPANAMAMLKALVLPRRGFDVDAGLPDIQAHWHGARAEPIALAKYFSMLGIDPGEFLPVTYPHVLVGTLHMNMLAHKSFPIRLLGALHLKNRIVQYRPIACDETLDIDARFGDYRLVEKGVEFDLVTETRVAGKLVWQETSIFFVRGRFGGDENPDTDTSFDLPGLSETEVVHTWHIPNSRGREYAGVSGDYNPIHISSIAAKLFGFERDIAHGFGVLAQGINYSKRLNNNVSGEAVLQVDVIFKGPVFLGSDVSIRQNLEQSAGRFDVYCADNSRPSLCVAITPIQ